MINDIDNSDDEIDDLWIIMQVVLLIYKNFLSYIYIMKISYHPCRISSAMKKLRPNGFFTGYFTNCLGWKLFQWI